MSMDASRARFGGIGMAAVAVTCASAAVVLGFRVPATASSHDAPPAPSAAVQSSEPRFVDPADLPQGARFGDWGASAVREGLPKRAGFCLDGMFKAEQTSYRSYRSNAPKVSAQEYLVQAGSETAAATLVAKLGQRLENCYREWLNLDIEAYDGAGRTASWERYRSTNIADGLTIYGVFTVPPKGFDKATHLYGVGRDGERVMVLHMSLVGPHSEAPDGVFRQSAVAAVEEIA
ncbi:MAG: hypothetical protein ACT4QG_20650 [Sporichthyaceae bacterium]